MLIPEFSQDLAISILATEEGKMLAAEANVLPVLVGSRADPGG